MPLILVTKNMMNKIFFLILAMILFNAPARAEDKLAAALANANVLDTEGHSVKLGESWRQRPVVLAFIRHFG